jgi:alkanesulfonate monooxygenase SsuD/methylene tetrahydromethanopterin reductase-like flavin-dependent oxidoreductase (luciferase family)
MRIGLINQLNGRVGGDRPPPTWDSILARAQAAEAAGFDVFVFEDALLYRTEKGTAGVWESTAMAAALAAATTRITLGPSVINSPYRSPAMTAKIAETIDEISGGRFVLGIGAGNTADSDYEAFGFPTDKRYSRFAEAIQIVHGLLKDGEVDFHGEYYSAAKAELVLRGPRAQGPPINIAAGSPKMLRLAARYGDQWNWWAWDETLDEARARFEPILRLLAEACSDFGRDPASLVRTLDLYTVVPGRFWDGSATDLNMSKPVTGSAAEIARYILGFGEMGFEEVRCDVWPRTTEAISAMTEVVDLVHRGEVSR